MIKESNKKKSQQNADNIQNQMQAMSEAFSKMNSRLEDNLKSVNSHILEVQKGNLLAQTPHMESFLEPI